MIPRLAPGRCVIASLLAGVVVTPSCGGDEAVQIVIVDPCCEEGGDAGSLCFRPRADYAELAVFEGGCPTDEALTLGETQGAKERQLVRAGASPKAIGELARKKYGFAVVLRDQECRVMAFGCTAANLDSIREVRVAVLAWGSDAACSSLEGGGCEAPEACSAGRCVSEGGTPGDADTPDVPVDMGTPAMGCTLDVVASGELPAPSDPNAKVTGPGIVSADTNFVVGWREMSSSGDWQVVLAPLSDTGTLGNATRQMTTKCAGMEPTKGFGMAWSSGEGLAGVADPDCGSGAGATFIQFDAAATVQNAKPSVGAGPELFIENTHALAAGPSMGTWELVYGSLGKALSLKLIGVTGDTVTSLFNDASVDFVQVATTSQVRATLANITGTGARLDIGPAGTASPNTLPIGGGEAGAAMAAWGALTAWGDRAVAVIPSSGGGFDFQAADRTGAAVGSGKLGGPVYLSGDVANLRNHLFVLGADTAAMAVYDVTGAAGTTLTPPSAPEQFTQTVGSTSLIGFDGTRVAMAAGRQRVAIAWLKASTLVGATTAGGWALLECGE